MVIRKGDKVKLSEKYLGPASKIDPVIGSEFECIGEVVGIKFLEEVEKEVISVDWNNNSNLISTYLSSELIKIDEEKYKSIW